jgi:hypothetical protein
MDHKTRANNSGTGVPQNRQEIYSHVIDQYDKAIAAGFFLEATALAESLIADRMESRLAYLTGVDVEFMTLGKVRLELSTVEIHEPIKTYINTKVAQWASKRNKVVHRAAKISKVAPKVWEDYLVNAKEVAEEGYVIFRELDNLRRLVAARK